jgi:hypothetical protein
VLHSEEEVSVVGLSDALASLQDQMAFVDLIAELSNGSGHLEILLKKHKQIALRMDSNLNHARPHIHIDYGGEHHIASYAIDNGERLVGKSKYDRPVSEWIDRNRQLLLQIWHIMRSSPQPTTIISQLRASTF